MDWPTCEYKTERARLQAKFATGLPDDYICEPGACKGGNIIGLYSGYNYGPCPACGGTGEAKELMADQAAEYLWTHGYIWIPERNHDEGVNAGQVKRVLITVKKYDPEHKDAQHGWRLWGFFEGDNLTEALQNGAKAIRGSAQAAKERVTE